MKMQSGRSRVIPFQGMMGHHEYKVVGFRKPRKGEFYIHNNQAYRSPNDLMAPFQVVIPLTFQFEENATIRHKPDGVWSSVEAQITLRSGERGYVVTSTDNRKVGVYIPETEAEGYEDWVLEQEKAKAPKEVERPTPNQPIAAKFSDLSEYWVELNEALEAHQEPAAVFVEGRCLHKMKMTVTDGVARLLKVRHQPCEWRDATFPDKTTGGKRAAFFGRVLAVKRAKPRSKLFIGLIDGEQFLTAGTITEKMQEVVTKVRHEVLIKEMKDGGFDD